MNERDTWVFRSKELYPAVDGENLVGKKKINNCKYILKEQKSQGLLCELFIPKTHESIKEMDA